MLSQYWAIAALATCIASASAAQIIIKARFVAAGLHNSDQYQGVDGFVAYLKQAIVDPLIWLGGLLLVSAAALWYLAMTKLPLSVLLPAGAMVAPLTVIAAHFFLSDPLTPQKMAAIAIMTGGFIWLGTQSV